MRDLDETDLEILQLLLADARRPYSDIADAVGLSAPAVSDRVARLQEVGVIERFTLDIDRSQLRSGIPVLVTLDVAADGAGLAAVRETLLAAGAVEHVFTTAEADLVAFARVPDNDVSNWLDDALAAADADGDEDGAKEDDADEDGADGDDADGDDAEREVGDVEAESDGLVGAVADVSVTLLAGADWSPDLGGTAFALSCAQCGNTVDAEGTARRVGGELYQFCCPSCEARFVETYEALERGAD